MANYAKKTKYWLDADTTYLVGVIIGDGNISAYYRTLPPLDETDPRIYIETGDKEFICTTLKHIIEKIIYRFSHPWHVF